MSLWINSLGLTFCLLWARIACLCSFPPEWQGRWYQSGLGEVVIRESSITKKGTCREHHRDYYLVENRDERCLQCLLMIRRHDNIIQYKESYCLTGDTLDRICTSIRVEAILYTLVREPSLPVACPFQEAYHFSYNNNTGGFCREPQSYLKACASPARFRFMFQHCPYAAYTHEKELDFECLAYWKDGSDTYMYGGFSGSGINEKKDIYRCFMYEVLGTVVYLSMSADATCRGLRSSRDGPLVMEFTKDNRWPQAGCSYPDWLTRTTWRDLSGKHVYTFDEFGEVMNLQYRRHPQAVPHIRSAFRCMNVMTHNTTHQQFVAVTFTSHECESKYQCVRIVRRRDNVLEIHKGAYVHSGRSYCHERHMDNASKHILIPTMLSGSPCPFTGRYYLEPERPECQLDLRSGCNRSSEIQIVSSCVAQPIGQLECLESWQEDNKNYVIARKTGDRNGVVNCFSFKNNGETIEFSTDRRCSKGAPNIFSDVIRYTFNAEPDSCDNIKQTTWLDMTTKDQTRTKYTTADRNRYNTGYKHTDSEGSADLSEFEASQSHDFYGSSSGHVVYSASRVTLALCFQVIGLTLVFVWRR